MWSPAGRGGGGAAPPGMEPGRGAGQGGRGWGHLGLFTRGVETEQVVSRWDLGFSPSEQGRAWGHFLGLQVLGGLQP